MVSLQVSLFGKFCARCGEKTMEDLDACKVQELFCYLLLHAGQPHHREKLANILWQEQTTEQSKNYLRRTLWQLQNAIKKHEDPNSLMQVDSDWIQLNCPTYLWVDTAVFEQAFVKVNGRQAVDLDEKTVDNLSKAIQVYHGDLLEGWYQEWCLLERERFRQMLMLMLDKLMNYYEFVGTYEIAISQGLQILRHDVARERTHRRLMRLLYLSGDRTGALRQYERCKVILDEELGVAPGASTEQLRHQIESDQIPSCLPEPFDTTNSQVWMQNALQRLQTFDHILQQTRQEVQQEIQRVESTLSNSTK